MNGCHIRAKRVSYCTRRKEGERWEKRALQRCFWNLKTGEGKTLEPVMIYGQQHYLEAIRLPDALLLVVCSGKKGKGLEEYGGRWQTRLCLAKGFNLEDRHMTGSGEERQTDGRIADRFCAVLSRRGRAVADQGEEARQ